MKKIAITFLLSCLFGCLEPADALLESTKQPGIVFVGQPNQSRNMRANVSNVDEFVAGTDIYLLRPVAPQGKPKNLTAPFTRGNEADPNNWGAALDPEISSDGKFLLFSMRERNSRGTKWYLYELEIETGKLLQLTTTGDDMDPYYLPDGKIVFTSTRTGIVDEYERRRNPQLHVGERDPQTKKLINIRQISQNMSHDINPFVYSKTGEIFYCRWEHLGRVNRMPIFKVDPDGTSMFVVYGSQTPRGNGSRTFLEARELRDGGLVASLMGRGDDFEGGAIAILDISESEDNLKFITPEDPFDREHKRKMIYKTPHPIMEGSREKIIAAGAPFDNAKDGEDAFVDYGLYLLDKEGGDPLLVFNDPGMSEFDPIPLHENGPKLSYVEKEMDPNVAEGYETGADVGVFLTADVYDRSGTDGHLVLNRANKNAKMVRVLEAVPMPVDRDARGGEIGNTNLEKERVVGYGKIEEDGSFAIEAPTGKALHVQTLDSNGMMLVSQASWIQIMPGEKRICTGCHAEHDRNKVIDDLMHDEVTGRLTNAKNAYEYIASFKNPEKVMEHAAVLTDTLEFFSRLHPKKTGTVQDVFNRRCIECHGQNSFKEKNAKLLLEMGKEDLSVVDTLQKRPTSVYERLFLEKYEIAKGDSVAYVTDRGASRSPLMWVLFNKKLNPDDLSEPLYKALTYDHSKLWVQNEYGEIEVFNEENRDLLRIIEWLDMGTQYSNTVGY